MANLDHQERKIVAELIKDPRLSDNQVSINTKIPVKTVNRKRKKLEEANVLHYFAGIDNSESGTKTFGARCMYITVFSDGITRKQFLEKVNVDLEFFPKQTKHIHASYLGESGTNLALFIILESRSREDLLEIYNTDILDNLKRILGNNAIKDSISYNLTNQLSVLHNYLPFQNSKNGKIKKDWPQDNIFISD